MSAFARIPLKALSPILLAATLLCPAAAGADVRLARIFTDHMVLQMGRAVPVWGWADPGEKVVVYFAEQQAETTAGPDGRWQVKLGPLGVGGPHELVVAGANVLRLSDVWTGEVWLCSGQSNMAMQVKSCLNAEEEIAASANLKIRHFFVPRFKAGEPQDTLARSSAWEVASPETVGDWSAVGYFFARELNEKLGVPVGIINSSWGGTVVEAWISRQALENDSKISSVFTEWPSFNEDESWLKDRYEAHLKEVEEARAAGKPEPAFFNQPTVLFNGMIDPLLPYAIRGAAWYQGESNAYRGYQYRDLFPALIRDWRGRFGVGAFPFLFVQLANFNAGDEVWPELREAQTMTLDLLNTGMAVTTDIGEADDIHPRNKQDVGLRLARAARATAYMERIEYSGPLYESLEIEGGKARISFTHTGEGLVVRDDGEPAGFEIAGQDRRFVQATARIEGELVVVWSDEVPTPVAVRYAWRDNPEEANLYNVTADGTRLPASSFRTDDWPGKTSENR
ncbi:MAG: sialate O-acetylesterase [Candidatus Glassbacteria bacterium]|nr:sialate O-acetylesterase [Candidatus Glassbacteria bacterium]